MTLKLLVKRIFITIIIISTFTVALSINYSYALNNDEGSKSFNINFEMQEFSAIEGFYSNVSSFNIDLPTSSWGIRDIELHFTDIEFGIETKIIEDQNYTQKEIKYQNKNIRRQGLSTQIKLYQPTIIYGLYLYGMKESRDIAKNISVQIRGYNLTNNIPNNTVFSAMDINISTNLGWYLQNFSSPIFLPKGNYFLVLNGSNIIDPKDDRYSFYFNDLNPKYPSLHFSEYTNKDQWSVGIQNCTLLYKLIQKVNGTAVPENIDMTIQIDDISYEVSNGTSEGKGYLKLTDINYNPNKTEIDVQVKNNKTSQLLFNLIYYSNIYNIFTTYGTLFARYNATNLWTLSPELIRISDNHIVKFNYPKSWNNLQVFKNGEDITLDVIIDTNNNYVQIPNDIVQNNVSWEIKAESPNIQFNLNVKIFEFQVNETLEFSIGTPILPGTYTSFIVSPTGISKELSLSDNVFSYDIPSNAMNGSYTAYIFWHNQTDAGVQSVTFQISKEDSPPSDNSNNDSNKDSIDLITFLIIIGVIAGVSVPGISGYILVKHRTEKHRDQLDQFLKKCSDILNLKHIIVLDIKSGIDIYSQSFEDENKELEATLISGFLQAIHNFGTEVIKGARETQTIKVEYKKSLIIMTEVGKLRMIVMMNKHPESRDFVTSIEELAADIYSNYRELLDNFQGQLKPFVGIRKLIENNLNVSLLYPLTVAFNKNIKLDSNEKEMVKRAQNFMKESNFNYFYSIYLLPDNVCKPKDYETILKLIEKRVFQPIERDKD